MTEKELEELREQEKQRQHDEEIRKAEEERQEAERIAREIAEMEKEYNRNKEGDE